MKVFASSDKSCLLSYEPSLECFQVKNLDFQQFHIADIAPLNIGSFSDLAIFATNDRICVVNIDFEQGLQTRFMLLNEQARRIARMDSQDVLGVICVQSLAGQEHYSVKLFDGSSFEGISIF